MNHTHTPNTHTLPMPNLQNTFPGPYTTNPHTNATEEQTTHTATALPKQAQQPQRLTPQGPRPTNPLQRIASIDDPPPPASGPTIT
ncbi:hypothetical protein ACFTXM_18080 [Streptomyces sp. NPDC056930]|uniref:hypothetical protein n=1 Tax=Streptomyces sp. NPDC056930 TaxID=3345967 RepID=UPI0036443EF7